MTNKRSFTIALVGALLLSTIVAPVAQAEESKAFSSDTVAYNSDSSRGLVTFLSIVGTIIDQVVLNEADNYYYDNYGNAYVYEEGYDYYCESCHRHFTDRCCSHWPRDSHPYRLIQVHPTRSVTTFRPAPNRDYRIVRDARWNPQYNRPQQVASQHNEPVRSNYRVPERDTRTQQSQTRPNVGANRQLPSPDSHRSTPNRVSSNQNRQTRSNVATGPSTRNSSTVVATPSRPTSNRVSSSSHSQAPNRASSNTGNQSPSRVVASPSRASRK